MQTFGSGVGEERGGLSERSHRRTLRRDVTSSGTAPSHATADERTVGYATS